MDALNTFWNWLKARAAEPSTWAGISAGAGAISAALQSKAGLAGAVVAAIVAITTAEKSTPSGS